jgi:predicted aminopeptidase
MRHCFASRRLARSGSALLTFAVLLCAAFAPLSLTGCYYAHLASGQLRLLLGREPLDGVASDPETPARLRQQLVYVQAARDYAAELALDVGGQYTSYVEWPGDRVVTTVTATRPGEVEAKKFRFPFVGRVPYKGFFDVPAAEREAAALRARGLDVCVLPVTAYSTLGWLDDPVTTPMLQQSNSRLAETVIHELVHATVFVESQPEFNEGVARFIGQEAAVRLAAQAAPALRPDRGSEAVPSPGSRARTRVEDDRLVAEALVAFQGRVAELYASDPDDRERDAKRDRLASELRAQIAGMPLTSRDPAKLAETLQLNNACVAMRGTYAQDLPSHERILRELSGDLTAFVARLRWSSHEADPRAAFFGTQRDAP